MDSRKGQSLASLGFPLGRALALLPGEVRSWLMYYAGLGIIQVIGAGEEIKPRGDSDVCWTGGKGGSEAGE